MIVSVYFSQSKITHRIFLCEKENYSENPARNHQKFNIHTNTYVNLSLSLYLYDI